MERQLGQRILSAVVGIGVAVVFGSGMAIAAGGVFKAPVYTVSPMTSTPTPDAEAGQAVLPSGQHGHSPASPVPLGEEPAAPAAPVHDALVPGAQAGGGQSSEGGEKDGKAPGPKPPVANLKDRENAGEAKSSRVGPPDDQCNNGNRGHEKSRGHDSETEARHGHCQ